jgi:hypothetical protein
MADLLQCNKTLTHHGNENKEASENHHGPDSDGENIDGQIFNAT